MNDKRFRELHYASGSREMFSYWYATYLLEFRRLYGLRYRPGSGLEADAFHTWLQRKLEG